MSNLDMAKTLARLAEGLAEYDHLPELFGVHVYQSRQVNFSSHSNSDVAVVRDLCAWATAFGVPVMVRQWRKNSGGSCDLTVKVELAGLPVSIDGTLLDEPLASDVWMAFGKAEVEPAALLAMIDGVR